MNLIPGMDCGNWTDGKAEEASVLFPESTHQAVWWLILGQRNWGIIHDISEMNPEEIEETGEMPCAGKD